MDMRDTMKAMAENEYQRTTKEEREIFEVTHPAFRLGYSMAYDMAVHRINNLLEKIDNLAVG